MGHSRRGQALLEDRRSRPLGHGSRQVRKRATDLATAPHPNPLPAKLRLQGEGIRRPLPPHTRPQLYPRRHEPV